MVEFALIAPILLLIVLGIVQFGHAWNAYQTVTDTAREATRTAAIASSAVTQDSVVRLVQNRLWQAGLDSTNVAVAFPLGFHQGTGTQTVVSLTYTYRMGWLQPLLQWTTGQSTISLKSAPSFRQE